ncbi:Holliday junction branch migration DNA helicase RuvB, partial [Streptomyces sp. SID7499]|nr:Holliday junction branch migration DNA helicase RuvB [Streptomyces sp. SID7499]
MNWDETGPETDEPTGPVLDDRLVDADADGEDTAVEAALRPKDLEEFVGQEKVREQLDLVLKAARARGATADHVLLSGAPGLG